MLHNAIAALARRYAHGADRDDLAQDGALQALQAARRVDAPGYCYTAARYGMCTTLRASITRSQRELATDTAPDLATHDTPESRLDACLLRYRVLSALHAHLEAEPELAPGVAVALHGEPASEVARERGLPVEHVYEATKTLKRRLRNNESLRALWAEREAA